MLALACDGPSADDYLPAMAWALSRAAVERLPSAVAAIANFSCREDFEEMWRAVHVTSQL